MDNDKVVKSHFLIHSKFHEKKLSAMERNLVTLAAKRLNQENYRLAQNKISRLELVYSFKRSELLDFFSERDFSQLIKDIKNACVSIQKKVILIDAGLT